jgi:hypothetical protein
VLCDNKEFKLLRQVACLQRHDFQVDFQENQKITKFKKDRGRYKLLIMLYKRTEIEVAC